MKRSIELIKNRSDIGAGTRGADLGIDAMEIAAINKGSLFFKQFPHVDVPTRNETVYENNPSPYAKHIKEIYQQCKHLSFAVETSLSKGSFPVVFSGDHSSGIGTVSGISAAFPEKVIGIIWIDAHADIHSPYTTPSGNMHGMPLAAVLGLDNLQDRINDVDPETQKYWEKLKALGKSESKLDPGHLIYFGVRDTEIPEDNLIADLGIKNFKVDEVRQRGIQACIDESFSRLKDCDFIYVSFDVDSMDSDLVSEGTGTPVPKGFEPTEIIQLLDGFLINEKVLCLEIVEVNPLLDKQGNKMAEIAFDIVEKTIV
ncbi:arginase [Sphingobacterium psychroaquaticum]|uniref:arginase n=1 Tax=Sphingobacterium psychroaquaticum TaxID=561061 RepID=UPI00106D9CB3|nr:arginase [Sphingobacterium psychroaquaticum]QBQ41743.1 arginase [Sphingobacterium psychroaquaticum]